MKNECMLFTSFFGERHGRERTSDGARLPGLLPCYCDALVQGMGGSVCCLSGLWPAEWAMLIRYVMAQSPKAAHNASIFFLPAVFFLQLREKRTSFANNGAQIRKNTGEMTTR